MRFGGKGEKIRGIENWNEVLGSRNCQNGDVVGSPALGMKKSARDIGNDLKPAERMLGKVVTGKGTQNVSR